MRVSRRTILAALAPLAVAAALIPPARAESGGGGGGGGGAASREYQLKAAFVYNFAQFVEWPDRAFDGPKAPLVITVLGAPNPYDGAIERLTAGKEVGGRPVAVRYAANPAAVGPTHVLVVCPSEDARAGQVVRGLGGAPVLTVGEGDDFTACGGVMRLFPEGNKLRFEINPAAAKRADLRVSAKLMQLARIYRDG